VPSASGARLPNTNAGYRAQFPNVRSLDKIIYGDRARPDRPREIYGVEGK
jgi:hypothetical protein